MPSPLPLLLLLFFALVHGSIDKEDDAVDRVEFFSNQEKGVWVSFLNLKTSIVEQKKKPIHVPDLRIKATLSTDGRRGSGKGSKGEETRGDTRHNKETETTTKGREEGSSDEYEYYYEEEEEEGATTTRTSPSPTSTVHPTTATESTTVSPKDEQTSTPPQETPTTRRPVKRPFNITGIRATWTQGKEGGEASGEEYEYYYEEEEEETTEARGGETKEEKEVEIEKTTTTGGKDEKEESQASTTTTRGEEEGGKGEEKEKGEEEEKEKKEEDQKKGQEEKKEEGEEKEEEEEEEEEEDGSGEAEYEYYEEEEEEEKVTVKNVQAEKKTTTTTTTTSTTTTPTTTTTEGFVNYTAISMDEDEPIFEAMVAEEMALPTYKSKIVVTDIAKLDTNLLPRELMSMSVRDEQVEGLREMLNNFTRLEEDTGESQYDFGGSYILPLLNSIGYDNNTAPTIFIDIPVYVRTQLRILHVGNFDSHLMEYSVDAEMNMRWFDLRLANNFSRPVRIREKPLIDLIWRPDPYFVNSKYSYFHRVSFPNFRMIITPQGLVSYTMRVTLLPSCPMIFCRYPHDRQECDLLISSIAYPSTLMHISWHSKPFFLQSELSLPELHVMKFGTVTCTVPGKLIKSSCLRLVLNLKREGGRFIVEKYIPSALAMMFSWVAPYVPYHYEEVRIVTPITVLLTLVQMEKGDQQVRTSYLTSIDVWFGVMKIFTVLSLIESLAVLALIKRGRAMEKMASVAANEYEKAEMFRKRRETRRWCLRLDQFTRVMSPIVFLAFLLYYVFFIAQGDESECVDKTETSWK